MEELRKGGTRKRIRESNRGLIRDGLARQVEADRICDVLVDIARHAIITSISL
jgi:hypothetical protein